ncbi:MAG TPA: hypothetical protein VJ761_23140 [Ktedonobacteraceae bacterium]|nr:hypothetical protein [Ktedonobacteraceae bacterium]
MTEYYTAEEAMKILRRTKTMFYQQVNDGEIPYDIDPGRKRGKKFPRLAIDILAKMGTVEMSQAGKASLSLTPQTIAELWKGMEITRALYGPDDEVPFETLLQWRAVNSDIYMSLKEGNNLIGAITFLPIDERVAIALIHGRFKEKDIPAYAVRRWTENNLSVYIPTIEVLPSGDFHRDKERGTFLLRHTIKWAVLMAVQHDIKNWYAVGATADGRNILEALGFKAITDLDNGQKGYVLETKREPVRLIGMYLKAIDSEKTA